MEYRQSHLVRLVVVLAVCGFGWGCAKEAIPVYPVSGVVTFQGKPLAGAIVMFKPKGDSRAASGRTLNDGTFQLATSGAVRSGAMAGDYDVLIQKEIDVDTNGKPIDYSSKEYSPDAGPQIRGRTVSQIPVKYNKAETSGLAAMVSARGKNAFQFDLQEE